MSAKPVILPSPPTLTDAARITNGSQWTTIGCIFAADFLTLSLVFGLTIGVRHLLSHEYDLASYFTLFPYIILMLAAFWVQGLYPGVLLHPAEEMRRIFFAVTSVFLTMACASFLLRSAEAYSRAVFLVTWACGAPLVLLARLFIRERFANRHWWGVPAVVLGSGAAAQRVSRNLRNCKSGIRIAAVLSEDQVLSWAQDLPPFLGHPSHAPALALSHFARYVIVAMPQKVNVELRHAIQDYCRGFSHVLLVPDMPGLCSLGMLVREIGGEVGFELPQRLFHHSAAILKRAFDLTLSSCLLVLFAPLLIIIAVIVRLTSDGPVLYQQSRYGRNGQVFRALKFRTMVPQADRALAAHLEAHPESRLEWARDQKLKNDPRVTPIGRWLRYLSLDELPQLFNVLAGDMSLVGPRPIVAAEIEKYGRGYDLYTRVRPGITGLWQVSGRNNTTYEQRVSLDEYYVHNWSVWLDLYVLMRTFKVVCTAEGAY